MWLSFLVSHKCVCFTGNFLVEEVHVVVNAALQKRFEACRAKLGLAAGMGEEWGFHGTSASTLSSPSVSPVIPFVYSRVVISRVALISDH